MSKLTLASLATLCLLFISCSKQETDLDSHSDTRIESRSAENNISIQFTDLVGVTTSINCTRAEVKYRDAGSSSVLLTYADDTTDNFVGNDLHFEVSAGMILDITTITGSNYEVEDFSASSCGNTLCYSSTSGNLTGTTTEFIIEDEAIGF